MITMQAKNTWYNTNIGLILVYTLFSLFFYQTESFAAQKKNHHLVTSPVQASLVVNAATGKILHQVNANRRLHPASLTKLMTIYLTFEKIKQGKLAFNTKLKTSKYAASKPRTNLGLKPGSVITIQEAVLSLIVKSANDSAVVLAEAIAGSEKNFAKIMTQRAKQLGMHNTNFINASGWHHPSQKTTAYDMAKLAIALKRDFPQYYHLFSRTSFYYKNTSYKGHNRVTENFKGATGMKTGYTVRSGWNLVTAATRGSKRLVGVVLGGHTAKTRDDKMMALLNNHFKHLETIEKKGKSSTLAMNRTQTSNINQRDIIQAKTKQQVVKPKKYVSYRKAVRSYLKSAA